MGARTSTARIVAEIGLAAMVFAAPAAQGAGTGERQASASIDGIWTWTLADTPNGLTPTIAWSGAASTPSGDIYIAGSDHVTNSALYRLQRSTSPTTLPGPLLRYVGDARAASEAADAWDPGDVAEKFHTRPMFHEGKVYVATLNYSDVDAGYLKTNGFHWYAYDTATGVFRDLSAATPTRTGAERGGLVAITHDTVGDLAYGTMSPTGDIYVLNTNTGESRRLGRPDYGTRYLYPGRAMWTDRRGRVYFSAGHDGTDYDQYPFYHVHYYDPVRGFGALPTWRLDTHRAIDEVQCFEAASTCYLSDDVGNIYRFTDPVLGAPTFAKIGSIVVPGPKVNSWVFQVSPDRKFVYLLTKNGTFIQFDLTSGTIRKSFKIATYDTSLSGLVFYGHDAWDPNGRFYVAAFPQENQPGRAKLLAIDPIRLLTAIAKRRI